ncbi:MAG: acyl-CoA dehydrogenase [Acidimicrobiia bacterium]|nr:acyl-CoA dehydrogenase [Acidimicrobiia bacterium]
MDFEFNEDQEALRDSVRRFLADRAPIAYVRDMFSDERGTTDAVWGGLVDLGVTGLLVPEAHGGAGMGMVDAAVVLEELGRALHPGPYAASAIGAVGLIVTAGTDDDHAALLPALASGERVGTVALYEPERRSEWRAPTTTAVPDGNAWRVNGNKVHVPSATAADVFVVTASAPDGSLGVFVVDRTATGVAVAPTPTVDGTSKQGAVTFVDAPAWRLGGDATDAVAGTVDRLYAAAVVDGVGAASRALEITVEYAKARQQFGAPIGSFQAVQHLCADMLRAVELARVASYYACWTADAADDAERHRATTLALAYAADELYAVGASAVQVHAGIGFTWEHDIGLYYKRLLTLQHTGGGTTDQLEELAVIALG